MCGIVGGITERSITPLLIEGLQRLEYRGYDSAGVAVMQQAGAIQRLRNLGKVAGLQARVEGEQLDGHTGIAHTRWATHGAPSEANAHPHMSGEQIALVHNGIIENYQALREELSSSYAFSSETDTEVIAHLIHQQQQQHPDILAAVQQSRQYLEGAYALAVMDADQEGRLIVTRQGSPLVIGLGIGENYIASDQIALLPVTQRFIFLEEGDVADIRRYSIEIYDANGQRVEREVVHSDLNHESADKGEYRHYMQKEMFEQPQALTATLADRLTQQGVEQQLCGARTQELLDQVHGLHIIACGTSYHAGLVARYWCESWLGLPCTVEVASEYRYRDPVVPPQTLFVTLSQSGETADTLAALRQAQGNSHYLASLSICNVAGSSLTRESDLVLLTHAGPEIGVASTKAFTTQLAALLLLIVRIAQQQQKTEIVAKALAALQQLPELCQQVLALDDAVATLSQRFIEKQHCLFLGRGPLYPIAMEGALKLKEISYIHAEAYPAGELKHGPLALVDKEMPVVVVAPHNALLEKLKSNLQEVRARGGELIIFAAKETDITPEPGVTLLHLPACDDILAPLLYTIPLQLLSYHVALLKGTDVDQPRNLAKSVTVE